MTFLLLQNFQHTTKLNRNVGGLAEYVGGRISSGRYVRENPSLMVHEVGHCLGREHTTSGATFGFGQCNYPTNRVGFQGPCGSCGEDAQFPYFVSRESDPSKFIAALGPTNMGYRSEVVGMNLSLSGPSVNYWNIYADFMSYCHLVGYPRWISKFTYEGIMTNIASRFGARGFAPLGRARQSQTIMSSHATPVPYLVIAGFIKVDDSEASLLPVLRVDRTQAIDPPSSGLYTLETQNNLGVMLASYDFDPSEGTEVPLVDRPFTLVVPDDPDIRRIVVKRNGVVLTEMAASQNPPVVMLLSPNGGEVFTGAEIPASWAGSDDDGDALTYSLLYSRDDGVTWAPVALDVGSETEMIDRTFLPGSTNARLRVIVSDGFWTAFDDSDDIFISAGHAPEIVKLDEVPGEELVRGSGMYLEAMVYDVEDGLLPGSNIVWGSDIQGILHTGTVVNSELAGLNLGLHQVQIVATDSDGHSVTGSTPVRVVPFTPAIVEKAEKHTGNLVRLSGTSAEDTEMLIERSTDFTTWTPVLTTYQFTVDFDLVTDGIETNEELGVFRAASRYRPPQIVEQSGATTSVFVNQAVVLYVEAFAEKPISYQWYFEGDPIPEATNTTHILTNVSLSAAGNYWVVMSNEGGTTTGATIFVDVQPSDDLFSAPTVITNFPALVEAVNSGYTLEPDEPLPTASASVGASVWFTWTAPSNTPVIIQTCESELDTVLAVWTGETLTSLVEVASNDEGASCSFDGSRVEFIATSGTTYRISVYGVNGESGLIIMSMYDQDPPPPPPSNDNFADAITLSGFGGAFSMSNNLATLEVDEPLPDNGLTLGASVWYTWTSPTNGLVRLNTCSIPFGFDSVLAVWTGATLQTLGLVGYNDDFCTARSQFDFVAVSGTVYRIAIYGKDGGEGAYDLGMQKLPDPPPNDAFATPMVITNFPSTNLATNAGATIEPGDPLDGFFASVWFQWTSPVTTNVTVQTCGSFFTTYVRVLTGDTLGSLTLVADNSPSCFNRSVLNFAATNGVTYRIGVARIGTSTQSSITLTIRNAP